ncbi:Dabb family protein [Microbacterium binotii]|uniref:Dabb family protein n=1 Tax=Microbacterium binotii TaxID=462710 RepID=UPI002277410C|nr:Dabb family protein [Microbacterium binotii]
MLFRVHDDVADERVAEAIDALRSLAVLPGVAQWRIERSLDARKGRVIVEDATFADRNAFDDFRVHPEHMRVAEQMSRIADWWNGDYIA